MLAAILPDDPNEDSTVIEKLPLRDQEELYRIYSEALASLKVIYLTNKGELANHLAEA